MLQWIIESAANCNQIHTASSMFQACLYDKNKTSCFDWVKFITEDKMETSSLFIQKVGGVTFRYRESRDCEWRGKVQAQRVGARILIKGKIY